jgi:hypothetical protein
MSSLWLKFRIWTKVAAFVFLLIYGLVFVSKNSERKVQPWFWFGAEPDTRVLTLVTGAFLAGVIAAILVSTTFRTIRQIRELRGRTRAEKMERQVAEMQAKAGRLQTRAGAAASADPMDAV